MIKSVERMKVIWFGIMSRTFLGSSLLIYRVYSNDIGKPYSHSSVHSGFPLSPIKSSFHYTALTQPILTNSVSTDPIPTSAGPLRSRAKLSGKDIRTGMNHDQIVGAYQHVFPEDWLLYNYKSKLD